MAFITAETRSSIVELAMGMLNQAPSTALLNTLIAKSVEGASLQDLADYLATTDAFTAEYPATQTAREFATEMFGKLITGGTLSAELTTAVVDILEGLLIAGTTKAEGFVAVIDFLANPANALHPDLGDIALSFQNRADAAEYFSITKELGGSTDAELAAAIASVTSDADTLTAANAAADATADAEEVVAGQTFTLTTGLDNKTLGAGDDTFNASSTTLTQGDKLTGGEGTDTLAISESTGDLTTAPSDVTLSGIENITIATTGDLGVVAGGTAAAAQVDKITFPSVTADVQQVNQYVIGGAGSTDGAAGFTYAGTASIFTVDADAAGTSAANAAAAINSVSGQTVAYAGGTATITDVST
ncbi:MAG: hypothetical protein NWS78_06750, partial [Gammaproteobacteria bacterium]|nr:hypothetical protein [Gammaproteobacteria bacterium]